MDAGDLHPLIAAYLEQDVQGSPGACRELLDVLEEVVTGRRAEWSGTGNAHTVTIRPDAVVIQNEWDNSYGDANLSPDVFRDCIKAWEACVFS